MVTLGKTIIPLVVGAVALTTVSLGVASAAVPGRQATLQYTHSSSLVQKAWWHRGWGGRGWGWHGGGRGWCYWHPRACGW
jgi:hypothetical protein